MQKLKHVDCEITKACNLNCIHCSAEAGEGSAPDMDFIKSILSQGHELGLKRVGITGGEPFLFPQELSDLIDFSYDGLGCPVHIHTNGTLTENLQILNGRQGKIENLTIALLGDRGTHDSNCGVEGSYEKIRASVQQVLGYQIPLAVFLIPLSNNYLKLEKGIADLYEDGVRQFRVMRLSPGGRARKEYEMLKLSNEQTAFFLSAMKRLGDELEIDFEAGYCTRLLYPGLKALTHHDKCMSGANRVHVNTLGYVFPCTASSGLIEMNIGNLHEQSLEAVWRGSESLKRFRRLPKKGCRVQQHYLENV